MQKIKDSLIIGFVAGILAPSFIVFAFYLSKFNTSSFANFLRVAVNEKMLSPLLSLSVLINLGLFYLFLKYDKLHVARGIILSTLVYGVMIVILKFAL
jgi:hypothetical protein